eukprot:scaffold66675_cov23-Tisochrysis_lutea.AAC.1
MAVSTCEQTCKSLHQEGGSCHGMCVLECGAQLCKERGFCVRGAYACLCSSSVIEQQVLFCK